jgi:hypothetical protein
MQTPEKIKVNCMQSYFITFFFPQLLFLGSLLSTKGFAKIFALLWQKKNYKSTKKKYWIFFFCDSFGFAGDYLEFE